MLKLKYFWKKPRNQLLLISPKMCLQSQGGDVLWLMELERYRSLADLG